MLKLKKKKLLASDIEQFMAYQILTITLCLSGFDALKGSKLHI